MYCYRYDNITPPYVRTLVDEDIDAYDRYNEIVLWDDSLSGREIPNVFLEYIEHSTTFRNTPLNNPLPLLTQIMLSLHMAFTTIYIRAMS